VLTGSTSEIIVAVAPTKEQRMARKPKPPVDLKDPKNAMIVKLADQVRAEVRKRYGSNLTYEERRDAAAKVMAEVLWADGDKDLKELVTDDDETEIDGKRYRRLDQASSAVYYGRWGPHEVDESLYREIGVHNGPTIKPLERRVGMVGRRMTPDLARIVGELSANGNSRQIESTMRTTGLVPPSRSFLEKRVHQMAGEIAAQAEDLEAEARAVESLPEEVASVSCGMDRMAVRMSEPHSDPDNAPAPRRTEPYERTPPEPREHKYRMAWAASATAYNDRGEPLKTWRYGAEANADPNVLARRVTADVAWLIKHRPEIPVHCVQDGAKELRVLPDTLRTKLPENTNIRELVDFEHLVGYLDDVVDACEPEGDPNDMKGWYRTELLHNDGAIDRIWRNLRRKAKTLPRDTTPQRNAVAAALSYIRKRRNRMRYASFHAANLTIGSGATEGTCGLMQLRVKRRGQSWEPPGLRGVLTIRGLVLSDRWDAAWKVYAAKQRAEVRVAA
jgi:hypothetical protein